jgi:hypothetical protein
MMAVWVVKRRNIFPNTSARQLPDAPWVKYVADHSAAQLYVCTPRFSFEQHDI